MWLESSMSIGDKGELISAYVVRPSGPGPFPGVVLVHHFPGWNEIYCEMSCAGSLRLWDFHPSTGCGL